MVTSTGAPLSPWALSYLYAQAIDTTSRGDRDPLPGQALVILARAISAEAIKAGLVPPPHEATGAVQITDPGMFGPLSLVQLIETRLDPAIAFIELVNADFGHAPTGDEPGYADFCQLMHDITVDGATPKEVLADPQVHEKVRDATADWKALVSNARDITIGAMVNVLTPAERMAVARVPLLATVTPALNDLLGSQTNQP